jgi:hypothetical protein
MSEKYIEYLCDLITDSHDPERQAILLKALDLALTKGHPANAESGYALCSANLET